MVKIIKNSEIIQKIEELESMIEVKETKSNSSGDDTRMAARESGRICNESQKWMDEINK